MFATHKLNEQGLEKVKIFKNIMANAMSEISKEMPDSRDASIFKTKVEEAVFFGTKAIASKPGNFTEVIEYPLP